MSNTFRPKFCREINAMHHWKGGIAPPISHVEYK